MPEGSSALVRARLEKLERLRARGVDPYPSSYRRTHTARQARDLFESLDPSDADRRTGPVSVAGRITALRRMGRATFVDLLDGSGTIQVLFRKNALPDSYDVLPDLDIGDWLGVTGPVFNTRTGQTSVDAQDFSLLCKSMRPLPEKWHGLTDVEARFRQRYLDLISNDEARRVAVLRARTVSALRRWMDGRGFLEVETPVLVPVAAGAMAHPFVTHHNALDRDLYLRIAHELYLKRLIVGGLEKVYEIGKVFRNEGVDLEHNPEFTMMESYEAYADYGDVMRMVEELVSDLARELLGTTVVELDGEPIDLAPPWARVSLREEAIRQTGIDFLQHTTVGSLQAEMEAAGIDVTRQSSWGGLVDKLISTSVEPTLTQPTFLVDYPVATSPLAKRKPGRRAHRRAVRGLRRRDGGVQRVQRAERPRRPASAAGGAGVASRPVPGGGDGPAGRRLRAGHRARHAADGRAGNRRRQAGDAVFGPQVYTRGGAVPAAARAVGRTTTCPRSALFTPVHPHPNFPPDGHQLIDRLTAQCHSDRQRGIWLGGA